MDDLTILYVTANEMPAEWLAFQLAHLRRAIGDSPIVSISREPMDLGKNILDAEPKSYWNIYMQMLRGARVAETPYVAMVEDDTLYPREHFTEFRPKPTEVSYNRSRWSLFTWDPIYCLRQRISNCSLIAPTKLLIEALVERKKRWPDGASDEITGEVGRRKVETWLRVTHRPCVEWFSTTPIVQLNHPSGSDPLGKRMWKKHGQIKAYDIPYWGRAKEIAARYELQ